MNQLTTQALMTRFTRANPPEGFYTYAYLREDGRPYYVGKGLTTRAWDRHGSPAKYWMPPCSERVLILKWGLTEEQAFAHEVYLIAVLGNFYAPNGLLSKNFDNGGAGATGARHTEEHKRHMRDAMTGRAFAASSIEKMSAAAKNRTHEHKQKLVDAASTVRQWSHPVHGIRSCSAAALAREFSEVEQGNLSKLVHGKISRVYGWQCLTPERQFASAKPGPKVATWTHADLGQFVGTATQLCAAFPGLYNTALNRVLRGVKSHHKGWQVAAA